MDALILPKKRKRARSGLNNRHLPSELLEEILLNLPQKSLLRFSAVSKSWNSMIFDPVFTRKHKNRAALLRRHRLVIYTNTDSYGVALISSDLRSLVTRKRHRSALDPVFSDTNIDARDFEGEPHLLACCDELWCVRVNTSIFLWNPSMRNIAKVPPPSSLTTGPRDFIYGLGYDSVNDDYKILKIGRHPPSTTELFSLKKKCWREIESVSSKFIPSSSQKSCEFVDGRFHWIGSAPIIASFDLSTEKYGEVALPHECDDDEEDCDDDDDEEDSDDDDDDDEEDCDEVDEVVTLNGKLCAYLNYDDVVGIGEGGFVLWVMEEYGVEKSWTKKFDIMLPYPMLGDWCSSPEMLTPLYFSDSNDLLVKVHQCCAKGMYILMYRNGEAAKPRWKIVKGVDDEVDAFFYVESLITVRISANTHIRFVE